MEKVDKYISELLYDHDCVIVPSFGGFIANYNSAKFYPEKNTFSPPSKSISFNKNLKTNDGLLANHIAIQAQTDYPKALKYIDEFVAQTNSELKKGKKINFEQVGTFYLNIEQNLQFEPDNTNYLLDAFGLSNFQALAVKRDTPIKQIKKELKDRAAIPQEKRKINVKRVVALTLAIPLIAALIWVPLKTDLLKNVDYSSLNPFAKKEKPIEINKNNSEDVVLPSKENTIKENTTTIENIVKPVVADSTQVSVASVLPSELKFHLVAGCFQIESNAINFVSSLREKNIDATIIGKNEKGLFVVSCGDYSTRSEAINNLSILRQQQPDAWLYKSN